MYGYPKAFNEGDKTALQKADAHWVIVEAKVKKYVKNLGGTWKLDVDPNDTKAVERHAEICIAAMTPPDRTGKTKKRRKKKGPI